MHSEVFLNYAQELRAYKWCGTDEIERGVSVGKPNGGIVYKEGGKMQFGMIQKIYRMKKSRNIEHVFMIVKKIQDVYQDQLDSHASIFRSILSLFKVFLGVVTSNHVVVSTNQIHSIFAYCTLKNNVFGIPKD